MRNDQLRRIFEKYGNHLDTCNLSPLILCTKQKGKEMECTCGFNTALVEREKPWWVANLPQEFQELSIRACQILGRMEIKSVEELKEVSERELWAEKSCGKVTVAEIISFKELHMGIDCSWKKGNIAEIKENWDDAGMQLKVLGPAVFEEQWWVPVMHPDEEDPTFHKEAGLKQIK